MDINYELYKVFYHVASSLSFSEASKQLFISQSAVSQSIKVLEKKLGITLFIRSTKRVQLTPEGEILFRYVEPAVNLIQRGEAQIMESSALGGGQIRIGASDTICRYFLVPYLNRFHREHAGVHIKVTNQTSTRCVDLLESGQVDLIVTNYPQFPAHRPDGDHSHPYLSGCVHRQPGSLSGADGQDHHFKRTAGASHSHAGPEKHHQRISPSSVSAAPAGSGAGDRAGQQRPAGGSGQHPAWASLLCRITV